MSKVLIELYAISAAGLVIIWGFGSLWALIWIMKGYMQLDWSVLAAISGMGFWLSMELAGKLCRAAHRLQQ